MNRPLPAFAGLPAVDKVLNLAEARSLAEQHGRAEVTRAARALLAELRERASAGSLEPEATAEAALSAQLRLRVEERARPRLRRVLNLTGTVLHTNLGRAVLPREALDAVCAALTGACALEYDLETGARGDRDDVVEELLRELTGAEAATVVNNNAAAVFLLLNTLALKREVVVSRSELVEIGGAFRIPDIMTRAGAKLVEVGATNRTHPRDDEGACGPRTAMLMKVHLSNYAITGFTAQVAEGAAAAIAHARGLPLVVDLGSGTLADLSAWGLPKEPTPRDSIESGADLVTFSGDKLLGGPQSGILVGRKDLIQRIKKNPLKRALRVGKITLAALEAVLRLYRDPDRLPQRLTTLAMLTRSRAEILSQAGRLLDPVQRSVGAGFKVAVRELMSQIGSGSLPVDLLPSAGLALTPADARGAGARLKRLEAGLRALPAAVIGYVRDGALHLDLRCLSPEDEATFVAQLGRFGPVP